MKIIIAAAEAQKSGWLSENMSWVDSYEKFTTANADAYIDLTFQPEPKRLNLLKSLPGAVFINSVSHTLQELKGSFIRFNGWTTLISEVVECYAEQSQRNVAEDVFGAINKRIKWVEDTVGFITPRVISMIINEAYLTVEEGVSTKEEIDIAMKLGTNYPYGPFEWADKIGKTEVVQLLHRLSLENSRYRPASLLCTEAGMN